jgi:DNA-binding XRE family transcriptional regulator
VPAGRPTLYKEAYCEEAISYMGLGYSLTAFAGEIGVSRETVYEWERSIPEFSDAIKKARAKRVWALEKKLLTAAASSEVTTAIFSLKNACPSEWRDKIEIDQTVTQKPAEVDWTGVESEDVEKARDILARATSPKPADKSKLNGQTKH